VFDLFLQLFDDGRLTDSKGRTIDGCNAIFIMTSNIASDKKLGFAQQDTEETKTAMFNELGKHFRPEFINRIDVIIIFQPLDVPSVRKILKPMLDEISKLLEQQHGVSLKVGEDAEEFLVRVGYSEKNGARELRRAVERHVQVTLGKMILSGKIKDHADWKIVCRENRLSLVPIDE